MSSSKYPEIVVKSDSVLKIEQLEQLHWKIITDDLPQRVSVTASAISIPAAIELRCLEIELSKNLAQRPHIRLPTDSCFYSLRTLKWPFCSEKRVAQNGRHVFTTVPRFDDQSWLASILHGIEDQLGANRFPRRIAKGLAAAIGEMLDNVWQHSEASVPALLGYEIAEKQITFAIADTGRGILGSLKTNPKYADLQTSMAAIKTAIQPGVSRSSSGGFGYSTLLRSVAEVWGIARLRSGEAALLMDHRNDSNRKRTHRHVPHLTGVQVSAFCSFRK